MPIESKDIEYRLSGGASNTSAAAALGGAMSTVEGGKITSGAVNNIFDDVTGDESKAGDIEYRAVFVKNAHATLTLQGAKLWIKQDANSEDDATAIALADEAHSEAIETIANESTAPSGPTFSAPSSAGTGLELGDLSPGEYVGIWIRRTISAEAEPQDEVEFILRVEGETAE
jgi:hypothetical protein